MNSKDLLTITISLFVLAGIGFLVSSTFGSSSNRELKTSSDNSQAERLEQNSKETTVENSKESDSMNSSKKTYSKAPDLILKPNVDYKAVIKTSMGDITVDLFEKKTPKTVNNFVFLAQEKFFDGTVFHRIIKDFMLQGGDPSGNGTGGPGYRFADEEFDDEYTAGTLAMANAGPNTNGSQFFIIHKDYPLDPLYVIFGRASDDASLKVIDAIANTPVSANMFGEKSTPVTPVNLNSVEILEN